ncbi:MAG: beta-N-acetylhexosaminidase [Candidatus Sigynarchaeum springense]
MVNIIPLPERSSRKDGHFVIGKQHCISCNPPFERVASFLANCINQASTFVLPVKVITSVADVSRGIVFRLKHGMHAEGYELDVSESGIEVAASEPAGAFYAVQTLRQLLDPAIDDPAILPKRDSWEVPCIDIVDKPRFPWRGFMLDVGRHFFGKEVIKQILDVMAAIKMNVFHWHLTDDQGWRIEIERYPRLVQVGSKRKDTQIGGYISPRRSGKPHEGYYTKDDAREIVAYARDRFITVVPEIEFPGHCTAALAAYPEFSCQGGPFDVPATFGIKKDVLCIGKERSFEFVSHVLDELCDVFPSRVIHVGGDETPTTRWNKCPDCKARGKAEHLQSIHKLQAYFTSRVGKMLADRGRSLMGWNEILGAQLATGDIVQFWTGRTKKILPYLAKGRKFVMSPFFSVYLDHDYVLLPLDMVYKFDPVPKGLPADQQENVLGIEVPLWTEWVRNTRRLHWQLFPRLLAAAETGWTPGQLKDYPSFKTRVASFYPRLEHHGIRAAPLEKTERNRLRKPLSILHLFIEPRIPEN